MNIPQYIKNYQTYLFRMGYAESTIKHSGSNLNQFLSYIRLQHITDIKEVNPTHINAYNDYLHGLKSRLTHMGLNGSTIQDKINVVRQFSQFLELTENIKIFTTTVDIIPSIKKHRAILTQDQIKQLYHQTDDSLTGMRERAILGLYYGCGLRYREGVALELHHIDYKKQLLYVLPGKNYKSRYVPINYHVTKDFKDYETYSRKCFKIKGNAFLSGNIHNEALNKTLQHLCTRIGIEKRICLHGLRHSIATHLLQQQMPLEQIAQFLGHTTLMATQVYTHIVNELNETL
jgi:integrase/recombinase XerD